MKIVAKPTFQKVGKALVVATASSVEEGKKIIQEMARSTQSYAKQITPVDTGRLRTSIVVGFPIAMKGTTATVSTNVHYAPYVHWGTYKMKGRPFLTEGLDIAFRKVTGESIARRLDEQYRKEFTKL